MTIRLHCFRLFQNSRGFEDWESYVGWDAEFESAEEAIAYLHDKCGWSSMEEAFVFDVDVRP